MLTCPLVNPAGRNEGLNMLLNDSSDSSDDEGPPPLESAEVEEER